MQRKDFYLKAKEYYETLLTHEIQRAEEILKQNQDISYVDILYIPHFPLKPVGEKDNGYLLLSKQFTPNFKLYGYYCTFGEMYHDYESEIENVFLKYTPEDISLAVDKTRFFVGGVWSISGTCFYIERQGADRNDRISKRQDDSYEIFLRFN